jgi:tetratricopeptide (TPR) repeat protein
MLEPLLQANAREPDLHYYLGCAYVETGRIWKALPEYERALELGRDPAYFEPLTYLYLRVELPVHALRVLRRMFQHTNVLEDSERLRKLLDMLEEDLARSAQVIGLPQQRAEDGRYELENGQMALGQSDFPAAIAANRRAIKLLGDWPPPHNNLSNALFYVGQPEEAIAEARRVLSHEPNNVQALSNAVRFLAWTGREDEARTLWARLKRIEPRSTDTRLKVVEAAAVLGEDEYVYQSLLPLDSSGAWEEIAPAMALRMRFFLSVAEANTGKQKAAMRRLKALQSNVPLVGEYMAALKAKQPGLGWTEHYPYFRSTELLPMSQLEAFMGLLSRQDELPEGRFREQVARFAKQFPQLVRCAEKIVWEDRLPEGGINMLSVLATPEAYAALRRFALGQAGDDDDRMSALAALAEAGVINPDDTLHVWMRGGWRDIQMRQYEISDEREVAYAEEVVDLLDQSIDLFKQGKHEPAERLLQRALELEPGAKEAYNNLAAIYSQRDEHERARDMLRAALEIDPLYVFPRCNLAGYLLDGDDIEGAMEMLKPLADVAHFLPQEMAFYSFTQARILMRQEDYDEAREAIEIALEVQPDYEPAKNLLNRLHLVDMFDKGVSVWVERQRRRDAAKRARLQAKLSTSEPSLAEALSLYSKDVLVGMGREVIPWGGWSGLRKADLVKELVRAFAAPRNLARLVDGLTAEERAALKEVSDKGGTMPWKAFDEKYGNDLDESPYWQWHVPDTLMGRLRLRGLLVEATVDGNLLVAIPSDLRQGLREVLR